MPFISRRRLTAMKEEHYRCLRGQLALHEERAAVSELRRQLADQRAATDAWVKTCGRLVAERDRVLDAIDTLAGVIDSIDATRFPTLGAKETA